MMTPTNTAATVTDTEDSTCSTSYESRFHTFVYEDHFGPQHERSAIEVHYTQALCMALGKQNDYTKEQSSWLKGFLVTKSAPSVLIESVDALLEQAGDLSEEEFQEDCALLASTFSSKAAPSVVYDMMCGACVGGFQSAHQWEAIVALSRQWHVSEEVLSEMRETVETEEAQRRHRLQRLFPKIRNIDHMLMMPRIETHMYMAHKRQSAVRNSNSSNKTRQYKL
ncbi:expressed unknown protein [Seminavis robusta]|uniref:Uncharacterized protein n=1 Tax=Seminavis robusta TaxID=568900 RepID=A0A9N8EIR3_9STRA|nr:expressed unknown protein [Seminavis robusta]|eukprot:Sro1055_g236070.1 n/a (224) ;mRNA; f:24834-25505